MYTRKIDSLPRYYAVVPDLVCYGKVIGGGMPIGAVGGRTEVMGRFADAVNGLFPVADELR